MSDDRLKRFDFRGCRCPIPIIRLNQVIAVVAPNEAFEVVADDPAFELDVQAWCSKTGHELMACSASDAGIVARVRRRES